ncbi:uroporphyrinogen-III C-methyltransferase [Mesorhizobium sp. 2RAF21]|uniref:uroporphyrinogen-III C-methyltransferase n=1 Tax=Mesorhizobium sp. 2RAF21 TaxID=3232995 RepID=UPI003F956867
MSLTEAITRLAVETKPFEPGHVWLAGAGPGRLGCLTLDVVAAVAEADAIVYDALVNPAVLRAASGAELHFVGKRAGQPSTSQSDINALLVTLAKAQKRVLRLKGGDPNVFGRGGEEALVLASAGIPFRFMPGITSGFGALASTGIPATLRGVNKAIIFASGHAAGTSDDLCWKSLAATGQPIVIYMGKNNLAVLAALLMAGGMDDTMPVAVITEATSEQERIIVADLSSIVDAVEREKIGSPALIVVGKIVAQRARLHELTAGQ